MSVIQHVFQGTYPAIVTPFNADGSAVDYDSLKALIDYQVRAGVQGIVVCGSTGEAATLSEDEYKNVVLSAKSMLGGRGQCIAGIGTNNTAKAQELAAFLSESKLDGILLVAPPYVKPPQRAIVEHFRAVKRCSTVPIIAYNVPGRSSVNIAAPTIAQLVQEGCIVGLKEALGSIDQVLDILAFTGDKLAMLSGEDSLVHATMASGGCGVISATANIIPEIFVELTTAALKGDWERARRAQFKALPIVRAMFMETNPIPVKTALALQGIIKYSAVRLPLVPAEAATVEKIRAVLAQKETDR